MFSLRRAFFASLLVLVTVAPAGAESVRQLDLETLVRLALEENLEILAQTYQTRSTDAEVSKAYGIYDPQAGAVYAEGETRDLLNFQFFSSESINRNRRFDFSLAQKLPTGADLTANWTNFRENFKTDPKPAVNPAYDSELKFSLVQPLLQDFGRTVTEQNILFAVKDREISVQGLRDKAFGIISDLRATYFDVLRLRENLDFRRTSVALAQKIMEENRARVDAGVLPPIEILEAEVGLKQRERELLDAQRAYDDALDQLALLINSGEPVAPVAETLGRPDVHFEEETGYRAALEKRPDLMRQLRQVERLDIERDVARNQVLPQVDLEASYSHKALEGQYSEVVESLGGDELANWEIGLRVSYPIGNREARNELLRTRLRIKQQNALLAQLKDEARKEIRAALRLLEVSDKIIDVTQTGRRLAEEKLRNLLKRKEVGLATTRDVLEGEDDLASAQFDETAALADYNNAITDYLRVSGLLLEHEGVRFISTVDADKDQLLLGVGNR